MRSGNVHPNPGSSIQGRYSIGTLNVGGPHISEKQWNGLLQELSSTGLEIIALQEVRFRKGAEWWGPKTEHVLRNYKLFTGRALGTGSDECFLVHETWAGYARLVLGGSLKRSARAVQLFGPLAVLETHTLRY